MLALALLVGSIGLADSVNPSTVAPALLLAAGPRPTARVVGFAAGVFVVSLVGGVLIVLGPGQLLLDALPDLDPDAEGIAELAGGVILLALAALLWVRRKHVTERIGGPRAGRGGAASAFLLGAGIMAVELPTAVPYFGAIAAILAGGVSLGAQLLLLVIFNVALVAPLLGVLAIRALAGDRAVGAMDALGGWLRERAAGLVAGLVWVIGAACLTLGIVRLA